MRNPLTSISFGTSIPHLSSIKMISGGDHLPPFQISRQSSLIPLSSITVELIDVNGVSTDVLALLDPADPLELIPFPGFDQIVYNQAMPLTSGIANGIYYIKVDDTVNTWYSDCRIEVPCIHKPLITVQWGNQCDIKDDKNEMNIYLHDGFLNCRYFEERLLLSQQEIKDEGKEIQGRFEPESQVWKDKLMIERICTLEEARILSTIPLYDTVTITESTGIIHDITGSDVIIESDNDQPETVTINGIDYLFNLFKVRIIFLTEVINKAQCCSDLSEVVCDNTPPVITSYQQLVGGDLSVKGTAPDNLFVELLYKTKFTQHSVGTGYVTGIAHMNGSTYYACNISGKIYSTINKGLSWTLEYNGTVPLYSIACDPNTGVVAAVGSDVAGDGTIITLSGGVWTPSSIAASGTLRKVKIAPSGKLVICGDSGHVYYDGNDKSPSGASHTLMDICFMAGYEETTWITVGLSNEVWITHDSGDNWSDGSGGGVISGDHFSVIHYDYYGDTVYIGNQNGNVYLGDTSMGSWTVTTAGVLTPINEFAKTRDENGDEIILFVSEDSVIKWSGSSAVNWVQDLHYPPVASLKFKCIATNPSDRNIITGTSASVLTTAGYPATVGNSVLSSVFPTIGITQTLTDPITYCIEVATVLPGSGGNTICAESEIKEIDIL